MRLYDHSLQVLQVHLHALQREGGGDYPEAGAWRGGRPSSCHPKFDSQQKPEVPRHRDLNNTPDQKEAQVPHGQWDQRPCEAQHDHLGPHHQDSL